MRALLHRLLHRQLLKRLPAFDAQRDHPLQAQDRVLRALLQYGRQTAYFREQGAANLHNPNDWPGALPLAPYEDLYPAIERSLKGERNVLWPGRVRWFAKSSGTTNDRSKYIPAPPQALAWNHLQAGRDLPAVFFRNHPESKLFAGRMLAMTGSLERNPHGGRAKRGDISAVLLANLPKAYDLIRAPDRATALLPDWEAKIARMLPTVAHQDVRGMVGVPTWTLLLLRRLIEAHPEAEGDVRRLWPNLEVFFHGAVHFGPYRPLFEALLPPADHPQPMRYMEVYNASEGFFAFQDQLGKPGMLLLAAHGVYYEFVPLDQADQEQPNALPLREVVPGETYELIISAPGLWRYRIGDTVRFLSTRPYRLEIVGRTKQFINAFGEELMVANAEDALQAACADTGARVADYTVGPVYLTAGAEGCHEWVIEFEAPPQDLTRFAFVLDQRLRQVNSDYDAKRTGGNALGPPRLHQAPKGLFYTWMKQRGKLGGQHKVPRLANDRRHLDTLLPLLATTQAPGPQVGTHHREGGR